MAALEVGTRIRGYLIHDRIGEGAFAKVYKAVHETTGTFVALKVILKSNLKQDDFVCLLKEVTILMSINHPFIAAYYEHFEDEDYFYISMEYVQHGTLLDLINLNNGVDEITARKIFVQIISVLDYLHNKKKIAHRDLKPENVLLDKHDNVKIIDFGLSKPYEAGSPIFTTACGSPAYVAPEIIQQQQYTTSTDIWSAGILLYAMIIGRLPFYDANMATMFQQILHSCPIFPDDLAPCLRDLIGSLLSKDPNMRPCFADILNHPWICNSVESYIYDMTIRAVENCGYEEIDPIIAERVSELGYNTQNLLNDVKVRKNSPELVAYNMVLHTEFDGMPVRTKMELRRTSTTFSRKVIMATERRASYAGCNSPNFKKYNHSPICEPKVIMKPKIALRSRVNSVSVRF